MNRLAKWRVVFASWQLGTRSDQDAECAALKDHREVTLMLRAEVTALTGLLIDKGIISVDEFTERVESESKYLCDLYETRFPGFHATDQGLTIDAKKAAETAARMHWPP